MTEPKQKSPYHIISLVVNNILRVSAVNIRPDGKVIELTGDNEQGKSSIINALWMAIGGDKQIPQEPIHAGTSEGKIVVELGDASGVKLTVTKRLKKGDDGALKTSLIVENDEGATYSKPQEILNKLIGALSFDPLDFIRDKPDAQYETLMALVPAYDFAGADAANKKDFDARTEINRQVKALQAQAAGIVLPEDPPTEFVDETAAADALQAAGEQNAEIERERARRDGVLTKISELERNATNKKSEAEELVRRAALLTAEAERIVGESSMLREQFEALPPLGVAQDLSQVRADIDAGRKHNAMVSRVKEKAGILASADELSKHAAELTKKIDARDEQKKQAVRDAKLPVEGISFADKAVLFNGFPLKNASSARQLEISCAIAAALNPRLRLVTIRDASLLDAKSWAALQATAERLNLQIIAETVQSGRAGAVVIEDGHVKDAVLQAAE